MLTTGEKVGIFTARLVAVGFVCLTFMNFWGGMLMGSDVLTYHIVIAWVLMGVILLIPIFICTRCVRWLQNRGIQRQREADGLPSDGDYLGKFNLRKLL